MIWFLEKLYTQLKIFSLLEEAESPGLQLVADLAAQVD